MREVADVASERWPITDHSLFQVSNVWGISATSIEYVYLTVDHETIVSWLTLFQSPRASLSERRGIFDLKLKDMLFPVARNLFDDTFVAFSRFVGNPVYQKRLLLY